MSKGGYRDIPRAKLACPMIPLGRCRWSILDHMSDRFRNLTATNGSTVYVSGKSLDGKARFALASSRTGLRRPDRKFCDGVKFSFD